MAAESQRLRSPAAVPESDDGPDPFIAELAERGVAPYARLLSPEQADELRMILEIVLETHPTLAPAVDRLRRRRIPTRSGAQPKRNGGGS
jgi:hypothetical protein